MTISHPGPAQLPSMPDTSAQTKCFVVFDKYFDRKVLVEAHDAGHAVSKAITSYQMSVGDVQEVDCDISEADFKKIQSTRSSQLEILAREFFAENRTDKLLIIGGIAILVYFSMIYDVERYGYLQKLQNRNIGCAVGIVLAAVGAIRIAISNNLHPTRDDKK